MRSDRSSDEPSCERGSEWHVTQCACGQLTIRIGPIRVEFSREEFAQLHRLVQHAVTEFKIAPSQRPVHQLRAMTI